MRRTRLAISRHGSFFFRGSTVLDSCCLCSDRMWSTASTPAPGSSAGVFIPLPQQVADAIGKIPSDPNVLVIYGAAIAAIPLVFALLRYVMSRSIPSVIVVPQDAAESDDVLEGRRLHDPNTVSPIDKSKPGQIVCWDPCTMSDLGTVPAMSGEDVKRAVGRARYAQEEWAKSSFEQRRHTLRTLLRAVTDNMDVIVRVACRDSGKTRVDACLGEVMTTCEKLRWCISQGEKWLKPEYRDSGLMNMHKSSRVEYVPVGIVGAIVPWNYPFHNVFNPIVSALTSGNGIVIKTSEYASWSTKYYSRLIRDVLAASGAPEGLVQIVTGFGETGQALIDSADKIIFVGSVQVGAKVQQQCSLKVKPVVLELGGKDPFIVCDDASPASLAQLACRGVFQNMGQNCAGPERFLVYDKVYDDFCDRVSKIVLGMRQGPTLGSEFVDCGAVRLPQHRAHLQGLVDDAVQKGAKVLAGGYVPAKSTRLGQGQFYPPTVLCDVTTDMRIMKEEIFGPIMCITRVPGNSDDEAVRIANDCDFALSSCAFSSSKARATKLCQRLDAGMASVNDLEGTTYLSQSLPFGGLKMSGFDRFAGPEGLRGLCHAKSIVQDYLVYRGGPFLSLPEQVAYPSNGQGPGFTAGLIRMLYGHGLSGKASGLTTLLASSISKPKMKGKIANHEDDLKEAKRA